MAQILEQRQSLHRRLEDQKELAGRLRSQLGQAQALANIGMISSMIAHEMNNILTPLGTYAELALINSDDKALTEKALKKAVLNSRRASKILESMLDMARGREQEICLCNVKELVDEIFLCLARDFSKDGIEVRIDIDEGLEVRAGAVCLQQVIMNLILNAREAMLPGGGTLTIGAGSTENSVIITVGDTGCGIDSENFDRIFESFFTTKTGDSDSERTGAGLGLAFCKRVIDAHKGSISVDSQPGKGTTFRVALPKG